MNNNQINLRSLLEQMSTEQLDAMLQVELQKDSVDENAVLLILGILKSRDGGEEPEINGNTLRAWEKYQNSLGIKADKPAVKRNWWVRAAAAIVVIFFALIAAPQAVEAETFVGMLTKWTDSIFEFFDPKDTRRNPVEYEFKTDHPGLQQMYDTVVEMGVTDPVVPMWLPEGFELMNQEIEESDLRESLVFWFQSGQEDLVIQIDVYRDDVPRTYHKDESYIDTREIMGTEYTVLRNNERLVAIWSTKRAECSFTINCQEDVFYKIIESIYELEVE